MYRKDDDPTIISYVCLQILHDTMHIIIIVVYGFLYSINIFNVLVSLLIFMFDSNCTKSYRDHSLTHTLRKHAYSSI